MGLLALAACSTDQSVRTPAARPIGVETVDTTAPGDTTAPDGTAAPVDTSAPDDTAAPVVGEIASAVSQMDTVVQNNAAGAEETASAAEELNAQAFELNEVVHDLGTMVDGTHRRVATEPSEVAPKATPVRRVPSAAKRLLKAQ